MLLFADLTPEDRLENGVIHTRKVSADIALKDIVVVLHKVRQPVYRRMSWAERSNGTKTSDKPFSSIEFLGTGSERSPSSASAE